MESVIALSEAKAELSSIVRDVSSTGNEYIVTIRNRPFARIVPLPKQAPSRSKSAGMLSAYASVEARAHEGEAWATHAEAKHARPA